MKYEHLPEGWRLIKLGDVLEQQYRQEKLQEGANYTTLGVRWYAGGTFIKQERDGDDISASYLNRVEEGDFIYNRLFAWKGSFAVVPAEHAGYYVSNEFPVFKVKVPDQVDLDYLLWYTKRAHFWEYIATLSTGTSNASRLRYKEEDLLRASIPLPPIDEQRRIAEVLRDADANLAHVEAQIEAVQEVKRGVIQRLFTYGLAGEGTPTKQTRIGEIPEHWHLSKVGKEFDVTSGFTFGPDRHPRQNKYKYLRVANVQREFIDLSVLAELEAIPDEIAAKTLLEGDILAVEGHANPLEIGRCALVTRDAAGLTFQNHLFRLRSRMVKPQYAIVWLNSTWMGAYWEKHSRTSSGLHTINRSMLNEVPFPVPTEEEQCEIAAILSAHNATIHNLQAEAASLREVKRGLMQKLLSGEVRV